MTAAPETHMEMYLHDSSARFCFVLRGELSGVSVRELENAWITADSVLGARDLVVDVSGLTNADPGGRELLFRMRQSRARIIPALPAEGFKPPAEPVAGYRWKWGRLLRDVVRATKLRHLLGRRRGNRHLGRKESAISAGEQHALTTFESRISKCGWSGF